MDFNKIDLDYIINWCVENKQVAWLKATASQTEKVNKHTGKIEYIDENGVKRTKVDKNSPTITVEKPISFISLKYAFCRQFMADIIPVAKEAKKPSMYDRIANL